MSEFPEKNEILIATVKKILPYGAFVSLPEYNAEGFLHISHVSSGWVKNIHEFISEGQRLVVKVHHIDLQKNQIDVSLKTVTDDEKRSKLDAIKRGKRGEKLLEFAIKNSKLKGDLQTYKSVIEKDYDDVLAAFEDAFEDPKNLDDLDIPKKLKQEIINVASTNIKKTIHVLSGIISLTCSGVDGLKKLKEILSFSNKNLECTYLGAPKYKLTFTCEDYKQGEKSLSKIISEMEKKAAKMDCNFNFERDDQ